APAPAWLLRPSRRRSMLAGVCLAVVAGIIGLDVRRYRYPPRRLASGCTETLAVALACWTFHRGLGRIIHRSSRRWGRPGRSWARALTSAVALRGPSRVRGLDAARPPGDAGIPAEDPAQAEDLAGRLRQLLLYA